MRAEPVTVRRVSADDWQELKRLRLEALAALLLEVHEDNPRARIAYERLGFAATGASSPYPLGPGGCELVMRKPLG